MEKSNEKKEVGIVFVADHWGTYTGGIDVLNESLCKELAYVVDQSSVSVICLVFGTFGTKKIEEWKKQGITLVPYTEDKGENIDEMCKRARKAVVENSSCQRYIWIGHDIITGEKAYKLSEEPEDKFALVLHTEFFSVHANRQSCMMDYKSEDKERKYREQERLLEIADWVFCVGPIIYEHYIGKRSDIQMIIPGLEINNKLERRGRFNLIMTSGRFGEDTKHQKRWEEFVLGIGKALDNLVEKGKRVFDYQVYIYGFSTAYTDEILQKICKEIIGEVKKNTKHNVNINLNLQRFDKERTDYIDMLKECSVFVMSSWVESFGLVAWEALEMGIPIVISQNSGIYKYLEKELGYSLRGLCGSFDVSSGDVAENMGKAISDILSSEKVEESAEKLRLEMLKQNRWEKCAITIAKTLGIKNVMSDEVFTDNPYFGFIYSKREFMLDELKKRIETKRINNKIIFFDGVSNENILKDDAFFVSLFELLLAKNNIEVYFGYPTEKAINERISQMNKEAVDIENLKKKTKLIAGLKEILKDKLCKAGMEFKEETYADIFDRIYLVPLDKSPNVYINIIDDDWYFTIKYEK